MGAIRARRRNGFIGPKRMGRGERERGKNQRRTGSAGLTGCRAAAAAAAAAAGFIAEYISRTARHKPRADTLATRTPETAQTLGTRTTHQRINIKYELVQRESALRGLRSAPASYHREWRRRS